MKKTLFTIGLALVASVLTTTAVRAEVLNTQLVTNQSAVITKTVAPEQLAAIIADVDSLGVTSTVPITTNNFATATAVPARIGGYVLYISAKPTLTSVTNTTSSGAQLVTSTVTAVRVPPLPLTSAQLFALETNVLGDVSGLGLTPSNTASVYLAPQTNSPGTWSATLRLK